MNDLIELKGHITEVRPLGEGLISITASNGVGTFSVDVVRDPKVGDAAKIETERRSGRIRKVTMRDQVWHP